MKIIRRLFQDFFTVFLQSFKFFHNFSQKFKEFGKISKISAKFSTIMAYSFKFLPVKEIVKSQEKIENIFCDFTISLKKSADFS